MPILNSLSNNTKFCIESMPSQKILPKVIDNHEARNLLDKSSAGVIEHAEIPVIENKNDLKTKNILGERQNLTVQRVQPILSTSQMKENKPLKYFKILGNSADSRYKRSATCEPTAEQYDQIKKKRMSQDTSVQDKLASNTDNVSEGKKSIRGNVLACAPLLSDVVVLDIDGENVDLNYSDTIILGPRLKNRNSSHVSAENTSRNNAGTSNQLSFIQLISEEYSVKDHYDELFFEDKSGAAVPLEKRGKRILPVNKFQRKPVNKFRKRHARKSKIKPRKNKHFKKTKPNNKRKFKSNGIKLKFKREKKLDMIQNFYNPDPVKKTGRRPIIIDGSNVAFGHARGKGFSCRGLTICIDYFLRRKHKVIAFVPQFRSNKDYSFAPRRLRQYVERGEIVYTPSRFLNGRIQLPYDDRYIVQCATELGGVIVSRDNYRDLIDENPAWRETIENRLLMFTWVGNMLIFPQDPLGRGGPSLSELLRFPK